MLCVLAAGKFDIQLFLSVCGSISIIGGAGMVIWRVIAPAYRLTKRVLQLEVRDEEIFTRLQGVEDMQKQQSKCLAAMLNHMITGNGIEHMKDIRDELLESIIEK